MRSVAKAETNYQAGTRKITVRRKRMLVLSTIVLSLGLVLAAGQSLPQKGNLPRVGIILLGGPGPAYEALRHSFGQLGYVEGRNIALEPRFAHGQLDRLPDLAADLVRLDVDVIAAVGAVGARAAKKATTQIPIVFVAVIDPVATGFVTALERPGGNVTGIMAFDAQQPRKQLKLLKEVFPNLTRVAILSDVDVADAFGRLSDAAARALGMEPQMLKVRGPTPDLEGAFSAMMKEAAEALVILEVPVTIEHQKRIAELAATHRLPTMFPGGQANAGGLIAYGTSILDAVPRMAGYVDKIIKGARAGELPVEIITRSELVFNLKTATDIGVAIPPDLLKRADRVIQ